MVFCTYCGQSFTRTEHLERHILTHTNVRPFKCFTCHMSFARRDLLQRHYTVHGRDANNQEGPHPSTDIIPKWAGRTPNACSNCAKTKTKCDKKFPCSRCAQRNLKCTLRPTRRAFKNMNRVMPPGEMMGSGSSSKSGNESQKPSGGSSPAQENGQVQPPNPQLSPKNGRPQPQPLSQPPSVPHSRNPSVTLPVQQIQNPTCEEKPLVVAMVTTTPPFFEQSPPNVLPSTLPAVRSPLPTPINGFVSSMSSYEDFVRAVRDTSDAATPRFMMDPWNIMSMGHEFDPMKIEPSLMMTMGMDITMGTPTDGIPGMSPEMSTSLTCGPVQTPIQTPTMDESFLRPQIGSSASIFYPINRYNSIVDAGIPDPGTIFAAQYGWTVFRCTPSIPSGSCPRIGRLNLERLEQSLKNHEG